MTDSRFGAAALTAALRAATEAGGIDIVEGTRVDRYNAAVEPLYRLPDFGRDDALVVLFGNSRALWQPFVAWLRAEPARLNLADPVDSYAERVVRGALEKVIPTTPWTVRYAPEPPPRRVAMQHLGSAVGVACLSPSHLSVHPELGPWLAWRAAAVVDVAGPASAEPAKDLCGPCPKPCMPALDRAVQIQDTDSERASAGGGGGAVRWCDAGPAGMAESFQAVPSRASVRCIRHHPAGDRFGSVSQGRRPETSAEIAMVWRPWLAVRDACPLGREHRYSEQQVAYHYTKDAKWLREAVSLSSPQRSS